MTGAPPCSGKEAKLKEVKSIIRSLLISNIKVDVKPVSLDSMYFELEGKRIPFREFGYQNLIEFLSKIPDTTRFVKNRAGEMCVKHVDTEKSAHISDLVYKQRAPPTKKRKAAPIVRRPSYNNFSSNNNNYYKSLKPSNQTNYNSRQPSNQSNTTYNTGSNYRRPNMTIPAKIPENHPITFLSDVLHYVKDSQDPVPIKLITRPPIERLLSYEIGISEKERKSKTKRRPSDRKKSSESQTAIDLIDFSDSADGIVPRSEPPVIKSLVAKATYAAATRVDEEAKPVRLPRRKSSPGRYSYVVHRVCHPVDEEAKPVRLPRRKSSPGRYSYVVQRVGHPGGRRSETSSTSSEKVVAGSIFLRGAPSMSPGWTKKRNQFDFPRRKSSPGRVFIPGAPSRPPGTTMSSLHLDFFGESLRRVGIHTLSIEWATGVLYWYGV
ncbi:unnamed protein product [Trichogramma brassicae]|uniref:HTH OST-type domain-containing protein n=1 Tax=Trichogramma brassicae TaxID=86971 RepID=A0A6H5HY66_9HYME|nr:unnamed protein product [Trichogramma brassicae]